MQWTGQTGRGTPESTMHNARCTTHTAAGRRSRGSRVRLAKADTEGSRARRRHAIVAATMPAEGPQIQSIGQIAVTVADLDRAVAFYQDVLGLTLLFRFPGLAFFD